MSASDAASGDRRKKISGQLRTGNDPYGPTGRTMGRLIVTYLTGFPGRRSK